MKFLSSFEYNSRRSAIFSSRGMTASSQPEATAAGVQILRRGGNAADAAVAMAAALQVTQPCSTGLGGDCFCLYYSASEKRVYAMNGSGRSPGKLNLALLQDQGLENEIPSYHPHTVTVPGAPAGWVDTVERFGSLPMSSILEPAIDLAENGFPVGQLTANWWRLGAEKQLALYPYGGELMIGGRGPRPGDIFKNPGLAVVLRAMAEDGAAPFYSGWIAERVVSAVQQEGGVLSMADLAGHTTEWVDPISTDYKGVTVWECPPNGQGIAALIGLNILSQFDLSGIDQCTRYHLLIESMRLAFADAGAYVADPAISPAPVEDLLSKNYAADRAAVIDRNVRIPQLQPGSFAPASTGGDTVYFSAADRDGNGCSFINSNYMGFGTGIVPQGCGFSLQNRGKGFSLTPGHPNCLEPGKRPYHTIIPGMATTTKGNDLYAVFGVMGGFMQPQGHMQVISRLVDDQVDPQAALDMPRFSIRDGYHGGPLMLEDIAGPDVADGLMEKGHDVRVASGLEKSAFGLGQIIHKFSSQVYCGGSDPRGDGCASGA